MFCTHCGGKLKTEQKFCPSCGHPNGEEKRLFPRDMLIRRAQDFSETYDMSLDIPGLGVWEFSKIDEFDPLHKLTYFKSDLIHDLMEFSKYEFLRENVEELVDEIYSILRKILLSNLKMWFIEQCRTFVEEHKDEFTYELVAIADHDIKRVYGLSKYLAIINCELKDWEGLQFTKDFLRLSETFNCKNNSNYERQFIREGKLLRLREFSQAKRRYDDLINNINESIVKFNPDLKEEIDQEINANAKKETKIQQANKKSVLTSMICGVLFPFLLMFQHIILTEFCVQYKELPGVVVFFVGAVLWGLLLAADIAVRNIPLITILNIIGLLLFFPVCLVVAALVAWLSKIFMFILAGIVILMVFFLHGDRTNL